jgi:hypothetical protein
LQQSFITNPNTPHLKNPTYSPLLLLLLLLLQLLLQLLPPSS